ncbi:MAG: SDR family NAD(P)-dependent oxidoreductase [Alphaproteobacteria bacterium]|nr:SDR family NAD(P)-dependent oxidoreductase [Alphaproteobacteria bacterium]
MAIVMTGATAGIGLVAAQRMKAAGAALVIGARAPNDAPKALSGARLLPLDLASLESVRAFSSAVTTAAAGPIEALVLNAGVQITRPRASPDGFELTFAVNHLAHYLLARLLAPSLAPNARIVLTSSGTHDPAERTGIPAPRHADARRLAFPDQDPTRDADPATAGRRAYSTSKLCNVMTARELAKRMAAARPDIAVAAFDPGFTPGTGLARDYPAAAQFAFKTVLPLIPVRGARQSTPARSGGFLADLGLGRDARMPAARGTYFSVRGRALEVREPSELARDAKACAALWDDSAALLGLSAQ